MSAGLGVVKGGLAMKRKVNLSKICCFVLGAAVVLIVLWIIAVFIQSAPFSDTKKFDAYTADQNVSEWNNTDINYRMENLPYFEDEIIKENEVGSAGSQSAFDLLKQ